MYLGPEMKFLAATAMKKCTDMFTVLALHAKEGQLSEKRNFDIGMKLVSLQPPILLVWLAMTQTMSHISDDIFFEDVGECDQPAENTYGTGCNPELRRDLQQSDGIDDDEVNYIQSPMKKLVVKVVLDALRIKHKSRVSVSMFEDVLEYGKTLLFTSLGDDVDGDILTTLLLKSWNDVQLLLKEEGYEDAKQ